MLSASEHSEFFICRLVRAIRPFVRFRRFRQSNVDQRHLPASERFEAALRSVGIATNRRPQTVSVDEWLALAATVGPLD